MVGRCDPGVLLRACRRGDAQLVQTLQRRYGAESLLRVRDCRGATCLHHAARGGHVAVLRQLTVWARDTAPRTLVGATPLHDTAVLGQLAALKWLLQHTACSLRDTDLEGCSVLHLAARYESGLTLDLGLVAFR
jgi:ankyrin repeat protein